MPINDPIEILLQHDDWATRQMLTACAPLSTEQFNQKFEIGMGSLQATLVHMLAAMRTWDDTLNARPLSGMLGDDGRQRTVAEILALHETIAGNFAATDRKFPLDEIVTRPRGPKTYSFPRAAVILHVATHGMHHRAQCLNMLRQLGVKPLPPSSVAEWSRVEIPK